MLIFFFRAQSLNTPGVPEGQLEATRMPVKVTQSEVVPPPPVNSKQVRVK